MNNDLYPSWETGWMELLTQLYRILMAPIPREQITKSQRLVLLCLASGERLTMSRIAAFLSSSREQATRAVSALASAGLVVRNVDPANRSRVLVSLSETGQAAIEQYRQQLRCMAQTQLDQLSEEERASLERSLAALTGFLQQLN